MFTSKKILLSAAVTSDRSGNERAVKRIKESGMIARGIHQRQDLKIMDNIWIVWGFQYNFMFQPIL